MNELEVTLRERIKHNAFMQHNYMELKFVEKDRAAFTLDIRPESLNPFGLIHGGAIYTLADNATGTAVHTDGRAYVTQTSSMHFLRNQAAGTVEAVAHVRHRGAASCLVAVDITGQDGRLLATGEFTFFCVDQDVLMKKTAK